MLLQLVMLKNDSQTQVLFTSVLFCPCTTFNSPEELFTTKPTQP
uniref:Uncharacterized protein n=1 Tax=Rhizophora mucronata TaxID=61149 RepID=A0A2P2PSU3_RHIMU